MKLLSPIARLLVFALLLVFAFGLTAQADNVQWRDASGQFRLIMLDPATTAYPALLYGSNQHSGPNCPQPKTCAFVVRGRIESAHKLVFEPLKLSAADNKTAGLEGHQSELPTHVVDATETVWSFYTTDAKQARLTCISPKTSCDYFNADILLNRENALVPPP